MGTWGLFGFLLVFQRCSVSVCASGWTLSFLSWVRWEPGVDQLSPLQRNLPSLPQAGDPAKCRHGHCPTAAPEANDPGPSCLQCCDHPWARSHFHIPVVACRPRPHPHPGLAFSGTFWSSPQPQLHPVCPQQLLCYLSAGCEVSEPSSPSSSPSLPSPSHCSSSAEEGWSRAGQAPASSGLWARCKHGA